MQITPEREIRCDALETTRKKFHIRRQQKKSSPNETRAKIFIRMIAESSLFDAVFSSTASERARASEW